MGIKSKLIHIFCAFEEIFPRGSTDDNWTIKNYETKYLTNKNNIIFGFIYYENLQKGPHTEN